MESEGSLPHSQEMPSVPIRNHINPVHAPHNPLPEDPF